MRASRSSGTAPSRRLIAIDHVEFEEALGQILGLAHVVDRLPDGPARRHRDELGLHPPPGGLFRVIEALRQRDAVGRRHLLEDLGLILLRQVFEDVDRIVGIEVAHALGDGLGLQFFEDLLAHRVVDFGERREVEVLAHQLDELRAQILIERLDQVAGVGLVQFADQRAQQAGVAPRDRLGDRLDKFGTNRAGFVAQRGRSLADGRRLLFIEHAGLGRCANGDSKRLYAATITRAIRRARCTQRRVPPP